MMGAVSGAPAATDPDPSRRTKMRVGDPVPDVELVDHEGRPWRLGEHRGRPVVLILHRHLA